MNQSNAQTMQESITNKTTHTQGINTMSNIHINKQVKDQAEALIQSNFENAPNLRFERFDEEDANGIEIVNGLAKFHDIRGYNEYAGTSDGEIFSMQLHKLDGINVFVFEDSCSSDGSRVFFEPVETTLKKMILEHFANEELTDAENLAEWGFNQ